MNERVSGEVGNLPVELYEYEKHLILEAMEAVERVRQNLLAHHLDAVVSVVPLESFVDSIDEDLFSRASM